MKAATLFLRLEGPFQSWGGRAIGRIRRTETVPTKSGVIALLGAACGLSRSAMKERLAEFNDLSMSVRVDRSGQVYEDFQTVGAKIGVLGADGEIKKTASTGEFETIVSPREYIIDGSFLVILRGNPELVDALENALQRPVWPLFLGRKRCVPGTRIFAGRADHLSFAEAIRRDGPDDTSMREPEEGKEVRVVTDLIDVETFRTLRKTNSGDDDSEFERAKRIVSDRLVSLDPLRHTNRLVLDFEMVRPTATCARVNLRDTWFGIDGAAVPDRSDTRAKSAARTKSGGRCLFCRFKPANPKDLHAHHLTYARWGRERVREESSEIGDDDLVMLCSECHAAVTLLEYQYGFGTNRIDPRNPRWRERIATAREARRRHSNPAHLVVGAGRHPGRNTMNEVLQVVESVIPVRAGSSYSPDCPGNRWLSNRHHVHQRLSMAFPEAGDTFAAAGYGVTREEGGFLFRIEPGPTARIVVRSRIVPDWGRAFEKCSWLSTGTIAAPRLLDLDQFDQTARLEFALEANPTKRLAQDGPEGKKGARVPLRDSDLNGWIVRRGKDSGFDVVDGSLRIARNGVLSSRMKKGASRHWDSVLFEGELKIADSSKFQAALINGIGPAKAFGFGLLSIAPVRDG